MTDETLDKLLQEFLVHKDPTPLKAYMADRSMDETPSQTSGSETSMDVDGERSFVAEHAFSEDAEQSEEPHSEKTTRLAASEIVASLDDIHPQFESGDVVLPASSAVSKSATREYNRE